jgi:hypothetical protein
MLKKKSVDTPHLLHYLGEEMGFYFFKLNFFFNVF